MSDRVLRIVGAFSLVLLLALAGVAPVAASQGAGPVASANYFGAIALEPNTGKFGWGSNYSTKTGAKQRAMNECRAAANHPNNCVGFLWVRNGCGAIAYKNNSNGTRTYDGGFGYTKRAAKQAARNAVGAGAINHSWVCSG